MNECIVQGVELVLLTWCLRGSVFTGFMSAAVLFNVELTLG